MSTTIADELNKIRRAIYGEEVRGSIVSAIEKCYEDTENGVTAAASAAQTATTAAQTATTAAQNVSGAVDKAWSATQTAMSGATVVYSSVGFADTSKLYVYQGSEAGYTAGDWYYYNGTAWVSGGVYHEVANGTITNAQLVQTGGVLSEVEDIRVGVNGTVYASAGEAIREQIAEIRNGAQGAGLSQSEKNLLLTLFMAIPFTADVSDTFNSIRSIWAGETPTSFSVTKNLTSCIINNGDASVPLGSSYSATVTPRTGYGLVSIVVTMGGNDITSSAVTGTSILIPSVTGNIVITAIAAKAAYTPVEYIKQSADGAYIDTGYAIKLTDTVEVTFAIGATSQWGYVFGANAASNIVYKLTSRGDNVAGRTSFTRRPGAWNGGNAADTTFALSPNTVYKFVETSVGTGKIYNANNVELVTLTDAEAANVVNETARLFIFATSASNSVVANTTKANTVMIYGFKIKNNYGVVIHDYIPVKNASDIACLYDMVDKEYLYDGTGNNNFAAGPEVTA